MIADSRVPAPNTMPNRWRWLRFLLIGFILWLACVIVMLATQNANFIPTVILLGSFLIPVVALVFDFDHRASAQLSAETVFFSFILGGLLGVLAAGTLEAWLVRPGPWEFLQVGLIEEFAKLIALVVVSRRLPRFTMRDGIVLGAAVGFGFAALESSGYAFNTMLSGQGLSIVDLVATEVVRGLLAPIGHGLWTAIVGATLFSAAAAASRLRLTWSLVGIFLLVSVLHALWDAMATIASLLTFLLTATPAQQAAAQTGNQALARPAPDQIRVFELLYWIGELLVSLVGIGLLTILWRRAGREPMTGVTTPIPTPTQEG